MEPIGRRAVLRLFSAHVDADMAPRAAHAPVVICDSLRGVTDTGAIGFDLRSDRQLLRAAYSRVGTARRVPGSLSACQARLHGRRSADGQKSPWPLRHGTAGAFRLLLRRRPAIPEPIHPGRPCSGQRFCCMQRTMTQQFVGRILSFRPLVACGLISYSLYLWHQPIFAFARAASVNDLSLAVYIGLIGLSVALALLTYRFVEQPFRDRERYSAHTVFLGSAVLTVTISAKQGHNIL